MWCGQSLRGSTTQWRVQYDRGSFRSDVMCYRVLGRGEDFIVGMLRAVKVDGGAALELCADELQGC